MRKAIGVLVIPAVIGLVGEGILAAEEAGAPARWEAFHLDELRDQHAAASGPWLPFLKVPALSTGLYVLPAGGQDRQSPHERDEVYYIIAGRATLEVDDDRHPVRAGSVVYVKAEVEHRFVEIEERLEVLVFFSAPTEAGGTE